MSSILGSSTPHSSSSPSPRVLGWKVWSGQYRALLRKHYILALRNGIVTLAQLGMGIIVCLLLLGFQALANQILVSTTPHPLSSPVVTIPSCLKGKASVHPIVDTDNNFIGTESGCTTLMYAPDTPLTRLIMNRVATYSNLDTVYDIVPVPNAVKDPWLNPSYYDTWVNITVFNEDNSRTCTNSIGGCNNPSNWLTGDCLPCSIATDNRTIDTWHRTYTNSTQNTVWFFGSYVNDTSYSIMYNISLLQYPWFADAHTGSVKSVLDTVILQLLAEQQQQQQVPPHQPLPSDSLPSSFLMNSSLHGNRVPILYPTSTAGEEQRQRTSFHTVTSTSSTVDYNVFTKSYPKPAPRIQGFDVFSANGSQWLFTVPAITFFFLLTELVTEKEAKLRVGMSQMGLRASAYWISWITYAVIISLLSTIILQIAGTVSGFQFYTNSAAGATFLLFLSFSWAMVCLAVLASTIITSSKTAQTVGYSFLLIGFLFQAIISSGYAGMLDLLYSNEVQPWVQHLRTALGVYPPFDFAMGFYAIVAKAGIEIDVQIQSIVDGPGFSWSDLFQPQTRVFFGYTCDLPAPIHAYEVMWFDSVLFLVLAFYLDAVLPGPQGTPSHPLFFLGMRYHTKVINDNDTISTTSTKSNLVSTKDPGVTEECSMANQSTDPSLAHENTVASVVRVHHLRVVYRSGWSSFYYSLTGHEWAPLQWLGIRSSSSSSSMSTRSTGDSTLGSNGNHHDDRPTASANKGAGDVIAVDDLSLTVRSHEILALLGHNGAGKTTTISVLTGLVTPSGGIAEIAGANVVDQPSAAQKLMGVCPQHDILWPQLTARETLRLFAAIKGVGIEETVDKGSKALDTFIENEIDRVLRKVSLVNPGVQHRSVGGYSGGMKRRLSVAIAALGKPKVLFLDEPTTGMDPVSKQGVWSLIHRLKRTAAVVLTTHSMEEADALGDRVAIMAGGKLEALGNPLSLKTRYGDGYRLSLVLRDSSNETLDKTLTTIQRYANDASLSLHDASNAVITIPFTNASQVMPQILDWCEQETEAADSSPSSTAKTNTSSLVREYGISGPSLESVFIKVSAQANFDLARSAQSVDSSKTHGKGNQATKLLTNHDDNDAEEGEIKDDYEEGEYQELTIPSSSLSSFTSSDRNSSSTVTDSPVTLSRGYHALVVKNLTLISRQRGLCFCQVITPILVLTLLVVLQHIIKVEIGTLLINPVPSIFVPLNLNQWLPVVDGGREPTNRMNDDDYDDDNSNQQQELRMLYTAYPDETGSTRSTVSPTITNGQTMHPTIALATLYASKRHPERVHVPLRSSLSPLYASNYSSNLTTDCLEFFIHAIQPADDSPYATNASLLTERIGYYNRVYANHNDVSIIPPNGYNNTAGLLSHIAASWCRLHNGSYVPAPYWDNRIPFPVINNDNDYYDNVPYDIDNELGTDLSFLVKANFTQLKAGAQAPCWTNGSDAGYFPSIEQYNCPAYILPDAAIIWHDIRSVKDGGSYVLSYTLQANDDINVLYHRPNGLSRLNVPGIAQPLAIDPGRIAIMDIITRAYAAWSGLAPDSKVSSLSSRTDSTESTGSVINLPTFIAVASFPDLAVTNLCQIVEIIGAVLHPITLTLQLPLFMFVLVLEKEERLVELQLSMGLRWLPYVTVTYFLNLFLYVVVAGLFWIAAAALQFTFFLQTSPVLLGFTLLGWGLCVCSLATLLSSFLWSRQAAVVIGFACGLFIPLLSSAISAGIYGYSLPWSLGAEMPASLYLIPLFGPCFAFVRILYLGTFNCLAKQQCLQDLSLALGPGTEERHALIALYLSAVAYQIIGLYLEAVLPRRYGVAKHPLFFLPSTVRDKLVYILSLGYRGRWITEGSDTDISLFIPSSSSTNGSLFAYILRWIKAANLTLARGIAVYARGEDKDVYNDRNHVETIFDQLNIPKEGGPLNNTENVKKLAATYPVLIRHLRKEFPVEAAARRGAVSTGKMETNGGSSTKDDTLAVPLLSEQTNSTRNESNVGLSSTLLTTSASVSVPLGSIQGPMEAYTPSSSSSSSTVLNNESMYLGGAKDIDSGLSYIEVEQAALLAQAGMKVAVSDMCLAVTPGTCLGLLGENGSGKSTTLNMLLGLYTPTGGDAYVSGHHTGKETDAVRLSLGVAPQHDTLWGNLTVEEHLLFYARVKGVPKDMEKTHVKQAMNRVGLGHVANRFAGALSGGMRRRLTLAISLIGNSRVVLLDEPSTGLDPASRRRLWRIIESARRGGHGRVLILVSHDMTEVETLATDIAIMTFGRVRTIGNGQHLKSVYGGGYQLIVHHTGSAVHTETTVTTVIPGARVDARFTGYLSFILPPPGTVITMPDGKAVKTLSIAKVFAVMGSIDSQRTGISEWGIGQQSLDTVFQRVVRHYRVDDDGLDKEEDDDDHDDE